MGRFYPVRHRGSSASDTSSLFSATGFSVDGFDSVSFLSSRSPAARSPLSRSPTSRSSVAHTPTHQSPYPFEPSEPANNTPALLASADKFMKYNNPTSLNSVVQQKRLGYTPPELGNSFSKTDQLSHSDLTSNSFKIDEEELRNVDDQSVSNSNLTIASASLSNINAPLPTSDTKTLINIAANVGSSLVRHSATVVTLSQSVANVQMQIDTTRLTVTRTNRDNRASSNCSSSADRGGEEEFGFISLPSSPSVTKRKSTLGFFLFSLHKI